MTQSRQGELLLKHYQNFRTVSEKQLAAITEDKLLMVEDFIAQKELFINEIKKWYEHHELSECMPSVTDILRQMIYEITAYEDKSQKILTERQEQVRKAMVVKQKSKIIQQAYEGQFFSQK